MTKNELKEKINNLPQNLSLESFAGVKIINSDDGHIIIGSVPVTLKYFLFQYIDELDTEHGNICKKITPKVLEKRIKLWVKSKNLDSEFEYLILDACLDLFSRDINWRELE